MFALKTQSPVNVHFSTFWNDFSHYSLFEQNTEPKDLPIDYSDLKLEHDMLADEAKYIN